METKEMHLIEQIRRDELLKQTFKQESESPSGSRASYFQMQLDEKDRQIQKLAEKVQLFESGKGSGAAMPLPPIMAMSGERTSGKIEFDLDDISPNQPMTKAEFLMAQIDLDPIQS